MNLKASSYIDTSKVFEALLHYNELGYKSSSVPTIVSKHIIDLTMRDDNRSPLLIGNDYYVGSAEQSFYQLIETLEVDERTSGLFMALTPCERDEYVDDTHFPIFMKLELIALNCDHDVVSDAFEFFKQYGECSIVGEDIMMQTPKGKMIEVASFGERVFNGNRVKFCTGIAEPRLTYATNN